MLLVRVLGSDFTSPVQLGFGPGIKVVSSSLVSSGEIRATIRIAASAALGARTVVVLNRADGGRGRCPACFRLTP
jgi:hypothetical protein